MQQEYEIYATNVGYVVLCIAYIQEKHNELDWENKL